LRRLSELIDRTWPRLPLALVALAALVVVVSLATAPGPGDAEQVGDVVEDFGVAAADRDGEGMCDALTPRLRAAVAARIDRLDCPRFARSFGLGTPGRQLRDAPREPVVLRGDRAAQALPTIGIRLDLERTAAGWRIAALTPIRARPLRPATG
jgi:hypothetical protein